MTTPFLTPADFAPPTPLDLARWRRLARFDAPTVCTTCGGTHRYLWTRPGAGGGEVVDRYGKCPDCEATK